MLPNESVGRKNLKPRTCKGGCIFQHCYPEHVYTWEGYSSSHSVSYPEHVYTWEGYSNRSVSSCVCVCVCLSVCLHLIAS